MKCRNKGLILEEKNVKQKTVPVLIIDSNKETIVGDLINYNIKIIDNKNLKKIKFKNTKNQTYIDQHLAILNNQPKILCNIKDAKNTLSFIERLKDKI